MPIFLWSVVVTHATSPPCAVPRGAGRGGGGAGRSSRRVTGPPSSRAGPGSVPWTCLPGRSSVSSYEAGLAAHVTRAVGVRPGASRCGLLRRHEGLELLGRDDVDRKAHAGGGGSADLGAPPAVVADLGGADLQLVV